MIVCVIAVCEVGIFRFENYFIWVYLHIESRTEKTMTNNVDFNEFLRKNIR